jgi:phosphoribosylanthranilate isomerase
MTRVKICGVTTLDDALFCAKAGADLLGFNFYPKSPRYLPPEKARQIGDELKWALCESRPLLVGVFVNETAAHIMQIIDAAGMDAAQLSGDESGEILAGIRGAVLKAIRPRNQAEAAEQAARYTNQMATDERFPSLLLDAYHKELYGGTGEQTSVEIALAVKALVPRLMLAGGLDPDNVAERARLIQPWGVDVASGVENGQPGIKDHDRVRAFIAAVRSI